MPKHIHCDLIKAWADGAKIEGDAGNGNWRDIPDPAWAVNSKYRIKRETVTRFGKELPKPLSTLIEGKMDYYVVDFDFCRCERRVVTNPAWAGLTRRGIVFANKEDAEETLKAFQEASTGYLKNQ